jgi:hypothetical protein
MVIVSNTGTDTGVKLDNTYHHERSTSLRGGTKIPEVSAVAF